MSLKKLRVAVLTQEDSFVIPENVKLLGELENLDVVAVVRIDAVGSLVNKKLLFIRGFGVIQVMKMGLVSTFNLALDFLDLLFLYRLGLLKSLKSASVVCNSKYKVIKDPNSQSSLDWLEKLNIDLVVSFSAPCIFKTELLRIPKLGCINLHCSLLPKYAGLLPSFWTLFENAPMLGATVHKMDDKIDNGPILGQIEVPRPHEMSMFNVIRDTKRAGGRLMILVINQMLSGDMVAQANHVEAQDYYSWPTVQEIKQFRRNGGRLI